MQRLLLVSALFALTLGCSSNPPAEQTAAPPQFPSHPDFKPTPEQGPMPNSTGAFGRALLTRAVKLPPVAGTPDAARAGTRPPVPGQPWPKGSAIDPPATDSGTACGSIPVVPSFALKKTVAPARRMPPSDDPGYDDGAPGAESAMTAVPVAVPSERQSS